jgi:hypothetical protein
LRERPWRGRFWTAVSGGEWNTQPGAGKATRRCRCLRTCGGSPVQAAHQPKACRVSNRPRSTYFPHGTPTGPAPPLGVRLNFCLRLPLVGHILSAGPTCRYSPSQPTDQARQNAALPASRPSTARPWESGRETTSIPVLDPSGKSDMLARHIRWPFCNDGVGRSVLRFRRRAPYWG